MRLDHLLSKELLTASGSACMGGFRGCQCCPLRRRLFCGGCSWVEYQQIKFLAWPVGGGVLALVRRPSFRTFVCGGLLGKRSGVLVAGLCLAHCWVLRQQCAKHNPATNTPDRFPNNPPTQKCEKELPYSRQDTTTNRPCQKLDLLIFHP